MEKKRISHCLLCGSPLVHFNEPGLQTCELCQGQFETQTACQQGHFVCKTCYTAPEDELIEKVCLHSPSTKPVELAALLIDALSVSMNGPLNQYLVPAVLLTAYYNQIGQEQEKVRKLSIAHQQARNVVGIICGIHGVCSTGIGAGIFISLICDSSPLAEGAWGLANQVTTQSLRSIEALGSFRCCKRDAFMAIKTATNSVLENFHVHLDVPEMITCEPNFYHQECRKEECPFSPQEL